MPAVVRLGDQCTGDGCLPPRPNIAGSPTVFVNGIAVHRQRDGWAAHSCGTTTHSGAVTTGGSGTVFANGKPLARIGDSIGEGSDPCGAACAQASPNVFAG
jgi:uncharacterized Zn-binding protein involved in type VI secretion